jgi:hypothetical protein
MTQAHIQAHTKRVCRYHIVRIPKWRQKTRFGNTRAVRRSANRFERFTSQATGFVGGP